MANARSTILDSLVTQLGNIAAIRNCVIKTLPLDTAQHSAPYIAVVDGSRVARCENATYTLYSLDVPCFLIADDSKHPIEHIIDDIENLIDSIDLGSACKDCFLIGVRPVYKQDPKKGDRYATVQIDLNIIYVSTKGAH